MSDNPTGPTLSPAPSSVRLLDEYRFATVILDSLGAPTSTSDGVPLNLASRIASLVDPNNQGLNVVKTKLEDYDELRELVRGLVNSFIGTPDAEDMYVASLIDWTNEHPLETTTLDTPPSLEDLATEFPKLHRLLQTSSEIHPLETAETNFSPSRLPVSVPVVNDGKPTPEELHNYLRTHPCPSCGRGPYGDVLGRHNPGCTVKDHPLPKSPNGT